MRLPPGTQQRDSVLKDSAQQLDFHEKYDFDTLIYDATYLGDSVVLVCPKLRNLETVVLGGQFEDQNDRALPVAGVRRYRRHDEVFLTATDRVDRIRLRGSEGLDLTMPVAQQDHRLDGLRVVSTKSFNNELSWISDWATHYVRDQGAQGIVLFDNASTEYESAEVLETLKRVAGLKAALVIDTPLRFGPMGTKAPMGLALFLQCGLLNITRHRFVSKSKSHLHCDIDELAVSDPGAPSLFERAERSFWGYATAPCVWRHAPGAGIKQHADHVWRTEPETGTKEKWAVVPGGRLRGSVWDCHGVGRYALNGWCKRKDIRFLHCAQIATGWKGGTRARDTQGLVKDPLAEALFKRDV